MIDLVANTPSDYALSLLTLGMSLVAILTCLTTVWRELASSLSTRTAIETLIEEYALRLEKLDQMLAKMEAQMDGGQQIRKSAE